MKRIVFAAIAGALFGLGLAVSGMTDPDKVLNFLDVTGRWDPSLALVMGGALVVSTPGFLWLGRRGRGFGDVALPGAPSARIDTRMVAGSLLFGMGWGIAGYCPGPAIASLAHLSLEPVVFVIALLGGSQLARLLQGRA